MAPLRAGAGRQRAQTVVAPAQSHGRGINATPLAGIGQTMAMVDADEIGSGTSQSALLSPELVDRVFQEYSVLPNEDVLDGSQPVNNGANALVRQETDLGQTGAAKRGFQNFVVHSRKDLIMQRIEIGLLTLALLFGGVGHTSADVIYDTTYAWDGSSVVSNWGSTQSGATPTYGQTFVAPANPDMALENFTFSLNGFGGGGTTSFTAAVYAWSGSVIAGNPVQGATGPGLYTSPVMSITDDLSGNFQQVTINTGGILRRPTTTMSHY